MVSPGRGESPVWPGWAEEGWQATRRVLAWCAQVANLLDLATTVLGLAHGDREAGVVLSLLIGLGYPEQVVVVAIKALAALTLWAAWWAAGRGVRTRGDRMIALAGLGSLAVLAVLLVGAVSHNVGVLVAP